MGGCFSGKYFFFKPEEAIFTNVTFQIKLIIIVGTYTKFWYNLDALKAYSNLISVV